MTGHWTGLKIPNSGNTMARQGLETVLCMTNVTEKVKVFKFGK